MRTRFFALLLTILLATSLITPAQAASGVKGSATKTPITHLVVLMQENHTFDNYFGTFPGANGYPAGAKMPVDPKNPGAGYVEPWHIGNSSITDLSHSAATFRDQFNNGKMDSFVSALNQRNQNGRLAMGYYDQRDIPYYWSLASEYVLFDNFFSSAKDGSFANHMYWITGQQPISSQAGQDLASSLQNVPTIFDRLQAAQVSWKFYVQNYDPSITYRNVVSAGNRSSQVVWVPLLNFDRFIDNPELSSHIVDLNQYFVDLRQGTLPEVSYIVPSGASEHPPSSVASGERSVKNLIQELMRSSAWDSSAFLLLYDDWGGWYDHVTPPQIDKYGYGLRVPGILASPYAIQGKIDHTQLDFTSVLKFIEYNWGVPSLAYRDANANNFLSAFDFSQTPRQPVFLLSSLAPPPAVKKDPSKIIYGAYGLALGLSILAIIFASIRALWFKTRRIEEVIQP